MKRSFFRIIVVLFALIGAFFISFFNWNTLYNDETKAAGETNNYPQELGEGFSITNAKTPNIKGDFKIKYIEEDKAYLFGFGGWFFTAYNDPVNIVYDEKTFEQSFMNEVNGGNEQAKAIYEALGSQVPEIRPVTMDDFNRIVFEHADQLVGGYEANKLTLDSFSDDYEVASGYLVNTKVTLNLSDPSFATELASCFGFSFCVADPRGGTPYFVLALGSSMTVDGNKLTFPVMRYSQTSASGYDGNMNVSAVFSIPCRKAITDIIYEPKNDTYIANDASSAKGTVLGTVSSEPEHVYPTVIYTIDQGSDKFTINENNEVIINIDNISAGTYSFTIKAHQDAFDAFSAVDLTSSVYTVVIEPPYKEIADLKYTPDSGKNPLYLETNVDPGRIGTVSAVYGSGSESGNGVRYSLTSVKGANDNAFFSIDNSGILSIKNTLTTAKTYHVEVTAQETNGGADVSGKTYTKVFSIEVLPNPIKPITAITFTPNYPSGKSGWTVGDSGINANGEVTGTFTFSGGSSPNYQKWEIVDVSGNAISDANFEIVNNQLRAKKKIAVGTYPLRIKVTDNQGETYTSNITITVSQAGNINITDKSAFYEFRLSDGSMADISKWQKENIIIHPKHAQFNQMKVDGSSFKIGDQIYAKEGTNSVTLQFQNADGTLTNPISEVLKIDKTKPQIVSVSYKDENDHALSDSGGTISYMSRGSIDIELKAEDHESGIAKYQIRLVPIKADGTEDHAKQPLTQEMNSQSGTFTYSVVNSGIYRSEISVVDEAGNISDPQIKTMMIDNENPIIEGVKDRSEYVQYYLPRFVSVKDLHSGLKEAHYTKETDAPISISGEAKLTETGSYSVYAKDNAGNEITISFKIVPLPSIDDIDGSDESKKIIEQIEKELDEIKNKIDETERSEYEKWIEDAWNKWNDSRKKELVDDTTGSKIEGIGDTNFDPNLELIVDPISENDIPLLPKKALHVYDVYLQKGTVKVQPDGSIKVYLPYSESEAPIVYEIDADDRVTELKVEREGDYVTFVTDTLEKYAISNEKQPDNEKSQCPLEGTKINIDTDKDGYPDLNIDLDGDCVADLSIDMDGDQIPDLNIDTDGDGKPDINIDSDDDGIADVNILLNLKEIWKLNVTYVVNDVAYNSMRDLKPDLNEDRDNDGKPDHNIDTNGDGLPDKNVDDDWWEKHGYKDNRKPNTNIGGAITGDSNKWSIWAILMIINIAVMVYSIYRKKCQKA